ILIERFNATAIRVINVFNDRIECFAAKSIERVIPLIPEIKPQTDAKQDNDLPNILFVGFDSVSRLNFDRHMPITSRLLARHHFYTMYGFNKVGDNTFPNLTPQLTGHYVHDIWSEDMKTTHFDYFPFIWKEYKERGFLTLYMEDHPRLNTFNWKRIGFDRPPTHYYLRPYFLSINDNTDDNCYYSRPRVEIFYEYLYDFVNTMHERKQKYFAYHFMVKVTHD
ncbi:unnamed protein product, partial [Oppiella nova]